MKTPMKNILACTSVLALVAGLTSATFAGPGPQFWRQQEKNRADHASKTPAAAPGNTVAMACASCQTTEVIEFRSGSAGGKVASRYDKLATKHVCNACGGQTTTVHGNTTG